MSLHLKPDPGGCFKIEKCLEGYTNLLSNGVAVGETTWVFLT